MTSNKIFPLIGFWLLMFVGSGFAVGQAQYVEHAGRPGSFPIVWRGGAATLLVDTNDFAGVARAAGDLRGDIARVTGASPEIVCDPGRRETNAIIIGTLGRSRLIDRLVREGRVDATPIAGKWESFFIQVVPKPFPEVANALVICGSDKRGTIYGVYDLSEQIGVSPWYWWADVTPEHQDALFVKPGGCVQGPPAVKYRGLFLNDEAPDLSHWITNRFGLVPTNANPPKRGTAGPRP